MRVLLITLVAAIGLVAFLNMSGAQTVQDVPAADGQSSAPIVAELFTSQSCSSCPPAERLFSTLAEREDLIVLEWHVDYWDRLVHGRAGSWKDPYSDAAYTKRQRDYNRALRGSGNVYTPQAVINGVSETVGSKQDQVDALLVSPPHATADLTIVPEGDQLRIEVGAFVTPLKRSAEIVHLTLLPGQTTSVLRGENRGATLTSKNIVLKAQPVGSYEGTAESLLVPAPVAGQTCAIIIQERRGAQLGPILGASYCS